MDRYGTLKAAARRIWKLVPREERLLMPRKLFAGLAPLVAAATLFAAPAAAQTPQFKVNGVLAGLTKINVTEFGKLTFTNSFIGEFKCPILAGAPVWNEGELGHVALEGWQPYLCTTKAGGAVKECPNAYVTAEDAVELHTEENTKTKKIEYSVGHGKTNLPWYGELEEPEPGLVKEKLSNVVLLMNCPNQGLELSFTGTLEPTIVNGKKNGLFPGHLTFEGQGGKTGLLRAFVLPEAEEPLYVSGELAEVGTGEQLINTEL